MLVLNEPVSMETEILELINLLNKSKESTMTEQIVTTLSDEELQNIMLKYSEEYEISITVLAEGVSIIASKGGAISEEIIKELAQMLSEAADVESLLKDLEQAMGYTDVATDMETEDLSKILKRVEVVETVVGSTKDNLSAVAVAAVPATIAGLSAATAGLTSFSVLGTTVVFGTVASAGSILAAAALPALLGFGAFKALTIASKLITQK